jgi:hypothetical protein
VPSTDFDRLLQKTEDDKHSRYTVEKVGSAILSFRLDLIKSLTIHSVSHPSHLGQQSGPRARPSGPVFPSGQSGQIWPSNGLVYTKGGFENLHLTGLQICES